MSKCKASIVSILVLGGFILTPSPALSKTKQQDFGINYQSQGSCREASITEYTERLHRLEQLLEPKGPTFSPNDVGVILLRLACAYERQDYQANASFADRALLALQKSSKIERKRFISAIAHILVESLWNTAERPRAVEVLAIAKEYAKADHEPELQLEFETNILIKQIALDKLQDATSTEKEVKAMLNPANTIQTAESKRLLPIIYVQLGYLNQKLGKVDKSKEYFELAQQNAIRTGDKPSWKFASFMLVKLEKDAKKRLQLAKAFETRAAIDCQEEVNPKKNSDFDSFCRDTYYLIYSEAGIDSQRKMVPVRAVAYFQKALAFAPRGAAYQYAAHSNLALAFSTLKTPEGHKNSIALGKEALKLLREQGKERTLEFAEEKRRIANSTSELGRYTDAKKMLEDAKKTATKLSNSAELVSAINRDLANITYNSSRLDSHQISELEAEVTRLNGRRSRNKPSLNLAIELLNLAAARLDQGNEEEAVSFARESVDEVTTLLRSSLDKASFEDMASVKEYAIGDLDAIYTYAGRKEAAAELAFYMSLNLHGLVQEVAISQASTKHARSDQKSAVQVKGMQAKDSNTLVYTEQIAKRLRGNEYLVAIKKYKYWDRDSPRISRWKEDRYLALILDRGRKVKAVEIGDGKSIDSQVNAAISATEQGLSDSAEHWRQVSDRLLNPIVEAIGPSAQRIYIVPDGEINLLPFSSLHLLDNNLGENLSLIVLSSGRDLLPASGSTGYAGRPVVVANPDFSKEWQRLPGSKIEGEIVSRILNGSLFVGKDANKKLLQELKSPRILHIATHAYWDPGNGIIDGKGWDSGLGAVKSGLVLSSAKFSSRSADEAQMNASEFANLNLSGTSLVVLSACDTAKGSILAGEGIYGLQKAIAIAGARASLVSLWKVNDRATAEFMRRFYLRLKAGEGKLDALREVQAEFASGKITKGNHDDWRHPYYWAAWQLVGDWGPIKGL